jgi:hypothetical protein
MTPPYEDPPRTRADEIAATAARMVVEEGLEYGPAKRRAAKQLGLAGKGDLPDNDLMETAVFEYLAAWPPSGWNAWPSSART